MLTIDPKQAPSFVGLGVPSAPVVFTVTNVGGAPSGAFTVTITGSNTFKISDNTCDKALPAGEMCQIAVVFDSPGGAGSKAGSLNIVAVPGGMFMIALLGDAV